MRSFISFLLLLATVALASAALGGYADEFEDDKFSPVSETRDEWDAENRGGRGRRDDDAPFRRCGAPLLRHIMDNNLCRPDRCEGISKRSGAEEVFGSRARRAPDNRVITKLCCENLCRPSQIRAICCGKA